MLFRGFSTRNITLLRRAYITYISALERVQRHFSKRINVLRHLSYEERLASFELDTLECRRLKADLTLCYKIMHDLPIKHRINFKIANITFRTLQSSQPVYLRSILHTHPSTSSIRLSNTYLLCAPFVRTSFGSRSFSVATPKIWNSLHPALRMCTSHDTFRHQLMTHYFHQAFQPT